VEMRTLAESLARYTFGISMNIFAWFIVSFCNLFLHSITLRAGLFLLQRYSWRKSWCAVGIDKGVRTCQEVTQGGCSDAYQISTVCIAMLFVTFNVKKLAVWWKHSWALYYLNVFWIND
jgi:hypothetical protein